MKLGDLGRSQIKGNDLQFYISSLEETREHTLSEFRKCDDEWLMTVDNSWVWGPTNNLCKWFHVCEHESHHLGQIDLLMKQLPSRHSSLRARNLFVQGAPRLGPAAQALLAG
jgi:uncharacterized damage-inducible protein DinB